MWFKLGKRSVINQEPEYILGREVIPSELTRKGIFSLVHLSGVQLQHKRQREAGWIREEVVNQEKE